MFTIALEIAMALIPLAMVTLLVKLALMLKDELEGK